MSSSSWKDDKAGMDNIEEVKSVPSQTQARKQPTTFGTKAKAHFRKFWWAHLLVFIIGTIVITILLCYVAFPRIAQSGISKSVLTVNSLEISNPTSTGFHLKQNSTIVNNTPYHPQLDAFNASLSLHGGAPYAYIEIPHLHATQQGSNLVDQDVSITDLEAFTAYNVAVLNDESVQVDVVGKTWLHEMDFPDTTVNYNTTTTMKGLNKLSGFNVTSFSIKLAADPDGTNMVGEVSIPNPTVLTLAMGNVTFFNLLPASASGPATTIGNSTLENLVLKPGNNIIPMKSIVDQTMVIEAIATTYKDGKLPVDIIGVSSIYNGQHLTYYEKALQGLTQHVTLDVGSALKAIGVDPTSLASLGGAPPSMKRAKRVKRGVVKRQ